MDDKFDRLMMGDADVSVCYACVTQNLVTHLTKSFNYHINCINPL